MTTFHTRAVLDVAVTLVPVRRYLERRGVISMFSADTDGIQMLRNVFFDLFPEYTIEDGRYGGSRRAVGIYEGQRFFTLIDNDPVEKTPVKWEDDDV